MNKSLLNNPPLMMILIIGEIISSVSATANMLYVKNPIDKYRYFFLRTDFDWILLKKNPNPPKIIPVSPKITTIIQIGELIL